VLCTLKNMLLCLGDVHLSWCAPRKPISSPASVIINNYDFLSALSCISLEDVLAYYIILSYFIVFVYTAVRQTKLFCQPRSARYTLSMYCAEATYYNCNISIHFIIPRYTRVIKCLLRWKKNEKKIRDVLITNMSYALHMSFAVDD